MGFDVEMASVRETVSRLPGARGARRCRRWCRGGVSKGFFLEVDGLASAVIAGNENLFEKSLGSTGWRDFFDDDRSPFAPDRAISTVMLRLLLGVL